MKYLTRTHKLRKDVMLAPVDKLLGELVVDDEWLECEHTNRLLGYGKGVPGIVTAKEHFAGAISGDNGNWALGVYRSGWPVGYVILSPGPSARRSVRFTMMLEEKSRGVGLAPTALSLLADEMLQRGAFYRLETEVFSTNKRAIKWLRHEGFTQEGFTRHSWWSDDEPHSTVILRMLAPHWRRMNRQEEVA